MPWRCQGLAGGSLFALAGTTGLPQADAASDGGGMLAVLRGLVELWFLKRDVEVLFFQPRPWPYRIWEFPNAVLSHRVLRRFQKTVPLNWQFMFASGVSEHFSYRSRWCFEPCVQASPPWGST